MNVINFAIESIVIATALLIVLDIALQLASDIRSIKQRNKQIRIDSLIASPETIEQAIATRSATIERATEHWESIVQTQEAIATLADPWDNVAAITAPPRRSKRDRRSPRAVAG